MILDERINQLIREGKITQTQIDQAIEKAKYDIENPVYNYDDLTLDEAQTKKIKEIKDIAGRKIGKVAPVWKQVNVLREKGKTATEFKEIDAIRTKSDDLEAQVNNATTTDEVKSIVWE